MSDIREKLKSHLDSGTSQAAVAKAIGVATSAVSAWLKTQYKGDSDLLESKISKYLELQAERVNLASHTGPVAPIQTSVFTQVMGVLRMAAIESHFGLIYGKSGIGKTTAIQAFIRENQGIAISIEADRGYTARTLFLELCEVLNIDTKGSVHDLLVRVVDRLKGSRRIIIIDEAEHLPYTALELIRRVRDKAKVGVVLVGMPRLKRNVTGDPNHFAQIHNRINSHRDLEDLSDADMNALIASQLGEIDEEARKALRKSCDKNARILCESLLHWCDRISRAKNVPITADLVSQAKVYSLPAR